MRRAELLGLRSWPNYRTKFDPTCNIVGCKCWGSGNTLSNIATGSWFKFKLALNFKYGASTETKSACSVYATGAVWGRIQTRKKQIMVKRTCKNGYIDCKIHPHGSICRNFKRCSTQHIQQKDNGARWSRFWLFINIHDAFFVLVHHLFANGAGSLGLKIR